MNEITKWRRASKISVEKAKSLTREMELIPSQVFAFLAPRGRYNKASPITTANNVLFVEDYGLNCKVDAIINETPQLFDGIKNLLNSSLKGGKTTLMLSCIGSNTNSPRHSTIQLLFDCLETLVNPNTELEYAYLSFVDDYFYDLRKAKKRPNLALFENGLDHYLSPTSTIDDIRKTIVINSAYPFMLQIRFKNKNNGSITLMDMMNTSYKDTDHSLKNSFHKLRQALKLSVNHNYSGVISTDTNAITFVMQDFLAGRSQNLTLLFLDEYCDADRMDIERAFDFVKDCRSLTSRVVLNTDNATGKLYSSYNSLKNNYKQLADHYDESRRRYQDIIKVYNTECLMRELDANMSKAKQLFQRNESRQSAVEHCKYQQESKEREHNLKMELLDMKMDVSKLNVETTTEKMIKEKAWQDTHAFYSICKNLEKKLSKELDEKAALKNANDELVALQTQSQNDQKKYYKSMEEEKKILKDMNGLLTESLKNVNDANSKLEDRISELRMGVMTGVMSRDVENIMSRMGQNNPPDTDYRVELAELQTKYDKLRMDFDRKGREDSARVKKVEAPIQRTVIQEYEDDEMIPREASPREETQRETLRRETLRKEAYLNETYRSELSKRENREREILSREGPLKETYRRESPPRAESPKKIPRKEMPPRETPRWEATSRRTRRTEASQKETLIIETPPPQHVEQQNSHYSDVSHNNHDSHNNKIPTEVSHPQNDNSINSKSLGNQLDNAFYISDGDSDDNTPSDKEILPSLSPSALADDIDPDLRKKTPSSDTHEDKPEKTDSKSYVLQTIIDDDEDKRSHVGDSDKEDLHNTIDDVELIVMDSNKENDSVSKDIVDKQSDTQNMSEILGDDDKAQQEMSLKFDKENLDESQSEGDEREVTTEDSPDLRYQEEMADVFDVERRFVSTPRRNERQNKLFDFSRKTPQTTESEVTKSPAKSSKSSTIAKLSDSDNDFQVSPELPPKRSTRLKKKPPPSPPAAYLQGVFDDDDSSSSEEWNRTKRGSTRGRGRGRDSLRTSI
ncbi:hypothetical protein K501DRAFT_336923 [Backusella circina FSU 941]|nr:hypothetical protein K501DRAFT_336923 [Backusella circina FSU 941]